MSNPTWNWLVILAPWSRLIFPVCSFLTCRRSVKRRWGAFNTDSPRSCLLDKIRRHLCDNTLPFQNCLEFGLTGIPVHKRVKKPQFEILSQNHTSKTFLQIMSFLLIKQKMISVSTFWKSPRLWVSSGSNIQRLITRLSVFFRSNIANLYPRSTTKYWLSLTEHIYFEQSTKKYWLALTVRIFFVWKVAQLRSFLQRCLFHPEEASILQWKNKTDDIFQVLQKKDGLSNGYIRTEEKMYVLIKWQVYMHMKHLRSKNYKKWMKIFDKLHTMRFAANMMGNFIFKIWKAEQFYD